MVSTKAGPAIFERMSQKRHSTVLRAAIAVFTALVLVGRPAAPAFAQANGYTYDIDALGIPKFVSTIYIDLEKVTKLSRYRSNAGHDYSDSTQFGRDGYKVPPMGVIDHCASMKHYFIAPDSSAQIYAPVSGRVTRMFDEPIGGTQIQITSDEQPAFTFTMFHVELNAPFVEGDHVEAGQNIGHHTGTQTWSDIAVFVRTPRGNHLISYFETMTDEAFEAFRARGIESREQLILSREYRLANPVFSCLGRATDAAPEMISLTGGAATQTIIATGLSYSSIVNVGAPPARVVATASSGLPVTIVSRQPKVCVVAGDTVTWRAPGMCVLALTQAGNSNTFAAQSLEYVYTVLPAGAVQTGRRPYLGGIHPSFTGTTESYLLFHNENSTPGTVTLSLFNSETGAAIAKWTSPSIPARSSRQFQIDDLEGAATAPLVRPPAWSVRVEDETTARGYMQHILYNRAVGGITNASSCDTAVTANPLALPYVYSATFEDFHSAVFFNNALPTSSYVGATAYAADSGAPLGGYYPPGPNNTALPSTSSTRIPFADLQTRRGYAATPENSRVSLRSSESRLGAGYLQHVLESRRAGVLSDMNMACALSGYAEHTVATPMFTAGVHSGANESAQSIFRFYNSGTTPGPVTVTLRDPLLGSALAQWTSSSIAPGAQLEVPVTAIEAATEVAKKAMYTATVTTDIDGFFQHLVGRGPGSALANFSTCNSSTTVAGATLIGVHSAAMAATGYTSNIIVNNTGAAEAAATIEAYDARDGGLLASYTTDKIKPNGQFRFDPGAIEARITMLAGTGGDYYILKLRSGFTGYLQHFVDNDAAGVITDLTPMCRM